MKIINNLFPKIKPIVESIIADILTFLQYLWYATFRRLGLFGYLGQAIFVAIGSIYATGIPVYCKIFKRDEADYMTLTTLTISIVIGIIYFLVDGIFFKGFLRTSVTITSRAFDSTEIKIKFGNIFYQDGWIVISVNNFFDNILDDYHVAEESLHGQMLKRYWKDSPNDWYEKIKSSIDLTPQQVSRPTAGKIARYPIGTTGIARSSNGKKFICVALSPTDVDSCLAHATYNDLLLSLEQVLNKAREVCASKPLNFPLLGGNLSRVNLPKNMLLNLLIMQIFNASKEKPITQEIRIVLPYKDFSQYNLKAIQKAWS